MKKEATEFKKGDLLVYLHNFYHPVILTKDGLHERENSDSMTMIGGVVIKSNVHYTYGVCGRSATMRQDYIYDNLDGIICNLGPMTFEEFYENLDNLVPQYASKIREEYDRQVSFINIQREKGYGLKGDTQEELFREKMGMFPLS